MEKESSAPYKTEIERKQFYLQNGLETARRDAREFLEVMADAMEAKGGEIRRYAARIVTEDETDPVDLLDWSIGIVSNLFGNLRIDLVGSRAKKIVTFQMELKALEKEIEENERAQEAGAEASEQMDEEEEYEYWAVSTETSGDKSDANHCRCGAIFSDGPEFLDTRTLVAKPRSTANESLRQHIVALHRDEDRGSSHF